MRYFRVVRLRFLVVRLRFLVVRLRFLVVRRFGFPHFLVLRLQVKPALHSPDLHLCPLRLSFFTAPNLPFSVTHPAFTRLLFFLDARDALLDLIRPFFLNKSFFLSPPAVWSALPFITFVREPILVIFILENQKKKPKKQKTNAFPRS